MRTVESQTSLRSRTASTEPQLLVYTSIEVDGGSEPYFFAFLTNKGCACLNSVLTHLRLVPKSRVLAHNRTGQCKRTGGCYNELVVAFFSTGGGVKG